jgi:ABC-2 type transport system ATP-binding protein
MSKPVVIVRDVTKTFKIPIEASSGMKQKLVNYFKGRKGYREFTPLNDISFTIHEGEFFGIVGRNGSGKSTLLKTIAKIYSPTLGSVEVNGSLIPFIELGVGFNPELTGRENIFLNGALLGFSHQEMEAMYDEIVEFAELSDFMEERLKNYSSGMQVRLAFSIAIRAQGDILLLDEVLAVGDEAFQKKCFDYFESLKDNKKTVIFVSHDMNAVQRFCNRALIIEKGKIKLIGSPTDIADEYREDNFKSIQEAQEKAKTDESLQLKEVGISISEDIANKQMVFKISHDLQLNKDIYYGISILKDGFTVAEINSKNFDHTEKPFIEYILDTGLLNPGSYELSAAVLSRKNAKPLAITIKRKPFFIKGKDSTRGGAFHLNDSWQ